MAVTLTARASSNLTIGEIAPSLDAISSSPLYIAHRGSALPYPEETMVAYHNAYKDGERFLECDVQSLSDGTLVMMHNTTVDSVTTSTGSVSALNAAGWAALAVDANTWHGSNYGDTLPAGVFQTFIDAFNGKVVFLIEDKASNMAAIVAALTKSGVRRDQAMLQSFTLADLAPAVRAGYHACFLTAGTGTPADVVAAGAEWVGISSAATTEQISGFVDAGLNVLVYTVNRRYLRDEFLALGVRGFFSDDPTYLKRDTAIYTSDKFGWQTWAPGVLSANADAGTTLSFRGKFFADDYWGYDDSATASYIGALHGSLSPVANPDNFVMDLKVTFVAASATDKWASVFISDSDARHDDQPTNTGNGYHLLMRKNGAVQIYQKAGGGSAVSLGATTGTTITDGAEATFRITVTPTTITLERTDVATSIAVTNSAYRGGYIHLGRNGLACKFRDVSVT